MNKAEAQNLWMKAIHRILWGLALCSITLGFYGLNYILPAIGSLLTFSGFYTLRHENSWFGKCFTLQAIRTAYYFISLSINLSWMNDDIPSNVSYSMTLVFLVIFLVELFCFGNGMKEAQEKAGITPHAGSVFALIPWNIAIACLTMFAFAGEDMDGTFLMILFVVLVVIFIMLLFSIDSLAGALEDEGYCVQTDQSSF